MNEDLIPAMTVVYLILKGVEINEKDGEIARSSSQISIEV